MKSSKTVEKKLDRLASELGTTIKGMTAEEKLEYARTDTVKAKKEQKSAKFERFPKRKLKATNKELKRTIRLMVDRVQKRVTVEPFNAICWRASDDSITSDFLFWGDTPLDPHKRRWITPAFTTSLIVSVSP
jgi:hypothetical protein